MNLAYRPEHTTVGQLAAIAVYAFAVGHPFNDANKRTALAVGDLILWDAVANRGTRLGI